MMLLLFYPSCKTKWMKRMLQSSRRRSWFEIHYSESLKLLLLKIIKGKQKDMEMKVETNNLVRNNFICRKKGLAKRIAESHLPYDLPNDLP